MNFSNIQKGIFVEIIKGLIISILFLLGGIYYNPFNYHQDISLTDKLKLFSKVITVFAVCFGFAIGIIARYRFFTSSVIGGSGLTKSTHMLNILSSILQNTLEQTILATLVYFSWIMIVPPTWLSVIPIMTIIFIIGRILFAIRYKNGAIARSFGFVLTFYPTMLMLALIICVIIHNFVTYNKKNEKNKKNVRNYI